MADGINYTSDLARYVLDCLIDNLTDKFTEMLMIGTVSICFEITRGTKSKFQPTIGIFSIAFAMSVIEKVAEFLNVLTMQYEPRYKW